MPTEPICDRDSAQILVIDDNPANLQLLAELLSTNGHRVRPATNAAIALGSIEVRAPDLILLGVRMPDTDGFTLCRLLKADPATRDVPVIFITVLSSDAERIEGFRAGAVDYITKPFRAEEVLARVNIHLKMRRLQIDLEAARRRSELQFAKIYESNMLAIGFWHEDGPITAANDAFCKIVGRTQKDVDRGAFNWRDMTVPGYEEADRCAIEALKSTGICAPYEKRFTGTDGESIPVLVGAATLGTSPAHGVMFVIDLRPFKVLEERLRQAQKMESIGMLAGGIAHDFNNLLTGVIGNASIIRSRGADPATLVNVARIEQAASAAADLTRQLLAYAGKGRMFIQSVDITRVVQEMVPLVASSISKKAVLRINCQQNLPQIETDESQMRQIVMNLVINASESLGDAAGQIDVSTGVVEDDAEFAGSDYTFGHPQGRRHVFIEVSDTGCGIDRSTLSRIFDPFFSTKFTGRGLGLSAIAGIIGNHHGVITVNSQQGRGSRFRVSLPVGATAPASTSVTVGADARRTARAHILVVDDEEVVRSFVSEALESNGYSVSLAIDGREAIDRLRAGQPPADLLVLDMTMPFMNGRDVMKEIARFRRMPPVILMSGHSQETLRMDLAETPPDAFIQKPFHVESLLTAVESVLLKRRPAT